MSAVASSAFVRFTWTRGASSSLTGVKWELNVLSDPGSTAVLSRQAFTVSGEPGEVISARVRAVRGTKKGPWSAVGAASIPTPAPPTPVPTPSGLTVTALAPTQATISWQGSVAVDRFEVFLDGVRTTTVYAPNLSATLTGLTAGATYGVRVQAIQGGDSSALSEAVGFTTPLTAPTGLAASSVTTTAALVSWQPVAGALSYEIFLNGALLNASLINNYYSFSGLVPGTSYLVGVRARYSSTAVSGTATLTVTTSADPAQAPSSVAAPVVTVLNYVAPTPGAVLASSTGTWSSSSSLGYTYQWQRSLDDAVYADISGATSSSYAVKEADLGYFLRVRVTALNANGSAVRASVATAKVAVVAPNQVPVAEGYAVTDDTLTFVDVTWSTTPPPTLTLTWQKSSDGSSWSTISSGSPALAVTDALFGQFIRVRVVATARGGSATYFTATRGPVASALNVEAPELTNDVPAVGDNVCTTTGTWTPKVASLSIAYSWQRYDPDVRTWSNVPGQSGLCYAQPSSNVGYYVRSVVSATNSSADATAVLAYSNAVGPVVAVDPDTLLNQSAPVVSGIPSPTSTLTTTGGVWTPASGVTLSYRWQRSLDDSTWTNVSGATSATYTPSSDAGYYVRSVVTAVYGAQSLSAVSAPTPKVGAPYASAPPTVSGVARVPQTLMASSIGTWANTPTSYTYQWQTSSDGLLWVDIAGATDDTFTTRTSDIVDLLRFKVTATNALGSTIAYSTAVGPMAPPLNTVAPLVTGGTSSDDTLYVTTGQWSGLSGLTYAYEWQYSEDGGLSWQMSNAPGLDQYVLSYADEGHLIRCRVYLSYASGSGSVYTSSALSNAVGPITP